VAARATGGSWPDGAFPAASLAAGPDETRAKAWDELWAAHESARYRLHRSSVVLLPGPPRIYPLPPAAVARTCWDNSRRP
nr:hypothetical protein [Actinomycetota bacterium]